MPQMKQAEITTLEEALNTGQGAGYVLDFSDRTYASFFQEEFGIEIDNDKYSVNGGSKGKRLRTFLSIEDGATAARVLTALWDHRASVLAHQGSEDNPAMTDRYFRIVHRLQGSAETASTDAIERFARDETLDELIAAIQRDISANKPQAALDRLRTYCMKKFGHLIESHGSTFDRAEPLHSRAGRYIKLLEAGGKMQPISARIMKSSISIFEEFNTIRNNRSLAHDNELVGLHEARFIFDSISSVLRFARSIEASRFGG